MFISFRALICCKGWKARSRARAKVCVSGVVVMAVVISYVVDVADIVFVGVRLGGCVDARPTSLY